MRRERKLSRRATTLANQRVAYTVPDTPGAAQAHEALAAPDEGLAMAAAAQKAGGWDDPAAAMVLAQSPSTAVKMRVALTRGTPREVLEHLAQDSDPSVAKFAAKQLTQTG